MLHGFTIEVAARVLCVFGVVGTAFYQKISDGSFGRLDYGLWAFADSRVKGASGR